jgi:hypothetical protein
MGSGDVSKADQSDNGVSVNTSRKSNDSNPRVIKTGTAENTFKLGSEQQFLAWERWHHRVGKLLTKLTNNAVAPKQLGIAVVGITIRRDRKLTAQLVSTTNDIIGQECLQAVQTLDGDKALEFPAESKREEVTFNLRFKKTPFMLPGHSFIKNDFERVNSDEK